MDTHGCVWVNIPGEPVAVGPSHFVSKPNPGCLFVTVNDLNKPQAGMRTTVTQVSGLQTAPGVSLGFKVTEGETINSSFLDNLNTPSQQTPDADRDLLNRPSRRGRFGLRTGVAWHPGQCPAERNINVYPRS